MSLYANLLYSGFVPVVGSPGNWSNMVQNGQHLAPAGPDEFLNEWIQELGHTPNHPSLHWFPTEIIKHKQYIYIYIFNIVA